jgi:flavin-dependent dehydrogenase
MTAMELERTYDCVVIGAGPAGSTTAALVAQQGCSTLLVEREMMPRFHVGESLMPETYWTFERLGILDELRQSRFVRKVGVQFVGASGHESQPFHFAEHDPRECSQTWHVERAEFDHLLFQTAAKQGATCLDGTRVSDLHLSDGPPHLVTLTHSDGTAFSVHARVVVDATGQQSLIANRLSLRSMNPDLKKASIWGHFRGARRTAPDSQEVTSIMRTASKKAWFWYIPLAENKVSVGLVSDAEYLLKQGKSPSEVFQEHVQLCPALEHRLDEAELIGSLRIAREFSYSTSRQAGDGWVLVGDAFGFIDPVYSTGVLLALRSAELAADAIVCGLRTGDTSGQQLGSWTADFLVGVERFRTLVDAFYTNEFSFAKFMQRFPDYRGKLIDLLIGRAFSHDSEAIVADLQTAVAASRGTEST